VSHLFYVMFFCFVLNHIFIEAAQRTQTDIRYNEHRRRVAHAQAIRQSTFSPHPIRNKTTTVSHLPAQTSPHTPSSILPSPVLQCTANLSLLVDPVVLSRLPALNLTLLEPESNLLLSVLNRVGAVAHVAADVEGEVATDGAGGRGERVGGAEDGAAGLDGVTAFPDHGADGAGAHV
jgi:hypothetical protein